MGGTPDTNERVVVLCLSAQFRSGIPLINCVVQLSDSSKHGSPISSVYLGSFMLSLAGNLVGFQNLVDSWIRVRSGPLGDEIAEFFGFVQFGKEIHVVVHSGPLAQNYQLNNCRYPSDDINKFLWMVRIGGGVFPEIKERDYIGEGAYRIDNKMTKVSILDAACQRKCIPFTLAAGSLDVCLLLSLFRNSVSLLRDASYSDGPVGYMTRFA